MHESLRSGSSKRGATSPLESGAKQGRLEIPEDQSQRSELVPQAMDFNDSSVSTINSLDSRLSTDLFLPSSNNFSNFPINESRNTGHSNMDQPWSLFQLDEYIPGTGPVYNGAANMNYDSSMPSDLPPMNSFHTNPWIPSFKLWLEDSKPADFLAIRKTQGNWSCQYQRVTWLTRSQIFRN